MVPDADDYDCQACGACCFGQTSRYAAVTGDDHARLGAEAPRFTRFEGIRCFMRMADDHCAALVFAPDRGGFHCAVYPRRPQVCRELQPGSPECRAERERKLSLALRFAVSHPGS